MIRTMMGVEKLISYRELFKKFNILFLVSDFLLLLLLFVVNKVGKFQTYSDLAYTINMRHKLDLHMPDINLTNCQKGAY
jgi:hypothetical protein